MIAITRVRCLPGINSSISINNIEALWEGLTIWLGRNMWNCFREKLIPAVRWKIGWAFSDDLTPLRSYDLGLISCPDMLSAIFPTFIPASLNWILNQRTPPKEIKSILGNG